ncbi:sensor histidine kinase [Blastopirellula marina]|uniref:histidine kinase n=1 Tax=Blastopirellula marina DSM 3645 TaxID=314230 RepID=A3ZNW7_9BACT|nr:ATP-binding protein [Blastopirellula marina]EAQ82015.1 putative two-component sensor [Blastopirellula marina DSM 3645]
MSLPARNHRLPETEVADQVMADAFASDGAIDVDRLLSAWDTATTRLQETHEALRREVARLSDELEIKNRELARKNRLADLGQMASHVAHEVRNSLMPLTMYVSMLKRQSDFGPSSAAIGKKIENGLTALDSTVNDLLHFTSDRQPQWSRFPLAPLLDEICETLAPQCEAQEVKFAIDVDPMLTVRADRGMVRRAVLNLALNSLDVMNEGGRLLLTACCGRSGVEIECADSGPGFRPEIAIRAFDPFFTTKNTGTGLGLAIVQRVAEAHGGQAIAMNCPEGGAAVTLVLPQPRKEAAA